MMDNEREENEDIIQHNHIKDNKEDIDDDKESIETQILTDKNKVKENENIFAKLTNFSNNLFSKIKIGNLRFKEKIFSESNVKIDENVKHKFNKMKEIDENLQTISQIHENMRHDFENIGKVQKLLGELLIKISNTQEKDLLGDKLNGFGELNKELGTENSTFSEKLLPMKTRNQSLRNEKLKSLFDIYYQYDESRLLYDSSISSFNQMKQRKSSNSFLAASDLKFSEMEGFVDQKKFFFENSKKKFLDEFVVFNEERQEENLSLLNEFYRDFRDYVVKCESCICKQKKVRQRATEEFSNLLGLVDYDSDDDEESLSINKLTN
eukprot:TRINITY_DN12687_c0_g1_i1.p1 TRINITY_DN12687_c0_g1~~TRINITY_DN12687_c0_g1_i1.p1  ORF type:complete len:323 (-),score=101.55 TRINITY_DN12687_c0_g1_i1:53-1021(-)